MGVAGDGMVADAQRGPRFSRGSRGADRILRAARTGPVGVAIRFGAMAVAAVGAAWVHRVHDPGVLCPIRRLTGVPCPFCGGTTVFIELGSADPAAAVTANPAVFAGALGLLLAPLGTGNRWWRLSSRTRGWILGSAVAMAWLWQLHRFGFLSL